MQRNKKAVVQKFPIHIGSILGTLVTAFLMGIITVFGFSFNLGNGHSYFSIPILMIWVLPVTLLFALILFITEKYVNKILADQKRESSASSRVSSGAFKFLSLEYTWQNILKLSILVLVLWMPWIIALYPGSMNWDTYYQISQCYPSGHPIYLIPYAPTMSFVDNYFSDHHPIFDTLIYGAFACSSHVLFGTWNYGVFAFVLLQSFGTAAAFVTAVLYLRKNGCPVSLCIGLLVFFAIMPIFPCYSATMLKDSLFSWLYVPWFIAVIEVARSHGECLKQRKTFVWLLVLSLLLCLTKKTGLYVVLGSLLILLIVNRNSWKPLLSCILSSGMLMWVVLPFVVFPLLDVVPGGKQEALAPIFQQTARYVINHGDEVTEEEAESIVRGCAPITGDARQPNLTISCIA